MDAKTEASYREAFKAGETCGRCGWASGPWDSGVGYPDMVCCRMPPVVDEFGRNHRPNVDPRGGCGEWKPKAPTMDQVAKPLESLNDTVQFTLTEAGAEMFNGYVDKIHAIAGPLSRGVLHHKQDGDVVQMVLWEAMALFGPACYNSNPRQPFVDCKIEVVR